MGEIPTGYYAATQEEFDAFAAFCISESRWKIIWESNEKNTYIWEQECTVSLFFGSENYIQSDPPHILMKIWTFYEGIDALTLYDVIHDPEYRLHWDDYMLEGYTVEQKDQYNIEYYAARMPFGIATRDFVILRSWRAIENKEFVIMNHSVIHPNVPEKRQFTRANSISSGYVIQATDKGCTLTCVTKTDLRGFIPRFVINVMQKKSLPQLVERLQKAATNYEEWKIQHKPDHRPWRGMTASSNSNRNETKN